MSHENDKVKFGIPADAIVMACPPDVNPDDDSVRYYGGLLVCESSSTEWRRRIVACVNACAGIRTDLLEAIKDFEKAGVQSVESVMQQRDELLAAMERIKGMPEKHPKDPIACANQTHIIAELAIASVKGGAA